MSLSEHAPSSILCVPTLRPIRANAQISSADKKFKFGLLLENEHLKPLSQWYRTEISVSLYQIVSLANPALFASWPC